MDFPLFPCTAAKICFSALISDPVTCCSTCVSRGKAQTALVMMAWLCSAKFLVINPSNRSRHLLQFGVYWFFICIYLFTYLCVCTRGCQKTAWESLFSPFTTLAFRNESQVLRLGSICLCWVNFGQQETSWCGVAFRCYEKVKLKIFQAKIHPTTIAILPSTLVTFSQLLWGQWL